MLGALLTIAGRLGGLVNAVGRSTVAIYGLLLLGYLTNLKAGSRAP